jgi:hypothetical protein
VLNSLVTTFTAIREGARVTLIDAVPQAANGRDWLRVRDESGIEGWVAAEYVALAPQGDLWSNSSPLKH